MKRQNHNQKLSLDYHVIYNNNYSVNRDFGPGTVCLFLRFSSASSEEVKAELNMYGILVPSLLLRCRYKKTREPCKRVQTILLHLL